MAPRVRRFSVGRDVSLGGSRELGFAAGAAEQHLFAIVREPMRRVRFDTHAANRITQLGGLAMTVTVFLVGLSVHILLAR
jgi:hypothetical protein